MQHCNLNPASKAAVLSLVLSLIAFLAGARQAEAQTPAAGEGRQSAASARSSVTLAGHTPPQVLDGRAIRLNHYDPEQKLRLALGVQVPHMAEEEQFLAELQDKQSPLFHQFLSAEEWNARFGPSAEDEQKIVDWAQSAGLTVTHRFANRLLVDVEAPAGVIEKVFSVTINKYQLDDRVGFSIDRDPLIPSSLTGILSSIGGLSSILPVPARPVGHEEPDYAPGPIYSEIESSHGDGDPAKSPMARAAARAAGLEPEAAMPDNNAPTGPIQTNGYIDPAELYSSNMYNYGALYDQGHCCNVHNDASGTPPDTSIALVAYNDFDTSNVIEFFKAFGLAWNYTRYSIDGTNNPGTECLADTKGCKTPGLDGETVLDLSYSTATSNSFGSWKDTSHVYVYEGVNELYSTMEDVFNFVLSDGHAKVVSSSWSWPESSFPASTVSTLHGIFNSMVGQGITLIDDAGDHGATSGCSDADEVMFPASDPDIIAAGGTTLAIDYSNGDFVSEVAWTGGLTAKDCTGNGGGGGGGVSTLFQLPSWQKGLPGAGRWRMVPDFSLKAGGYGQSIYGGDDTLGGADGTSIVAPELAGFFAQENAYLNSIGDKCGSNGTSRCEPIGDPNPLIYEEGKTKDAAHDPFYDIIKGCNSNYYTTPPNTAKAFCAGPGYDEATGWGSANMLQLAWAINWEVTKADGKPYITFTGPETHKWYNSNQEVKWTIHDFAGTKLPASIGTGIAGSTASWDSLPADPSSQKTPGAGNSFYSGPANPNEASGCLALETKTGCQASVAQGCHTAHARGWNNQGWSTEGNPSYPETYGPICFDNVAPTVSLSNNPPVPAGGWYRSSVIVTVKADDPGGSDASGIADVYYGLNNTACTTEHTGSCSNYSIPIFLTTQGFQNLTVFAKDKAGNFSTRKSENIRIDTAPPVTKAGLSGTLVGGQWQSAVTVVLTATDNVSGVNATYYSVDGGATVTYSGSFKISAVGSHSLSYWSVDVAGNTETAQMSTFSIYSPTTMTLTASTNPSVIGQSVTLSATVTATLTGAPTGTVSFYNGSTLLGTGTLTGGVATFVTTALPLGGNALQATYPGASFFLASSPALLTQTVITLPTATTTTPVLSFNPAAIGISAASAQTLTASFTVSGSFTPTAMAHYGHDYKLGAVNCTAGNGQETCTVPVTFLPTLPGARKDAVQLMAGSAILCTALLGGTGQGPMALIQPGVVTSPVSGAPYYVYQSVVDENGTVYFLVDNGNAVYSLAKGSSSPSTVPVTGLSSPHGIDIDGAGTLYIAQNNYGSNIVTYNTVTGAQGSISVLPTAPYKPCSSDEYLYSVAVDDAGNLFALDIECSQIFELKANGTYVTTAISPAMTGPNEITVDAADNVFIGGYDINELTAGGTQTQINTVGAGDGLLADAADTLYATRYSGSGGVAELPASNYSESALALDPASSPLGEGLGSDGTLYVGNYTSLDKVDRSQGLVAFGEQTAGFESTAQDVSLYNGGNKSLTVLSVAISGAPFNLLPGGNNNCTAGLVIAPGASCEVAVTITPQHAGTYSGTVTFTSNSLNSTSTVQTVALTGFVYGVYMVPSPTTLTFANQAAGTTSAASMVMLTNEGDLYAAGIGTPSSSSSAFNATLGTCTVSVAVGSSCQLSVIFSPTEAQTYSGTITVPAYSGGGGTTPSATFTVSGKGVASPAPTPPGSSSGGLR
jgi:hypothetical protein